MSRTSTTDFHEKFDEQTLLKLELFRAYARKWLPVFLSRNYRTEVNVFDFFAGPGMDADRNPGSPLILLEEAKSYYARISVSQEVHLNMYFSDKDARKTRQLRELVEPFSDNSRWKIDVRSVDFARAYTDCLPRIRDKHSVNLVIIDQFGYKHMPPEVFASLASCAGTDVICFVTSSNIRRFVGEDAVQRYIGVSPEEISSIPASNAHRYICDFYRSCVADSVEYYVAPFSIKRKANYNGLIFGSGKLLGLEKFLEACWSVDELTGEANYAIDNDPIITGKGQLSFLEEDNVPKKQSAFAANLVAFLSSGCRTNKDIYRFTLENGFLPKHVSVLLRTLADENALKVEMHGSAARRAFYISWDSYNESQPKAYFCYKSQK